MSSRQCQICILILCAFTFPIRAAHFKLSTFQKVRDFFGDVTGKCVDVSDKKIVESAPFDQTMSACAQNFKCVLSPHYADCVSNCLMDKSGLSKSCAQCYGADAGCSKSHCAQKCAMYGPDSTQCRQCSADFCEADLEKCTGLTNGTSTKFDDILDSLFELFRA
eukprot:134567_1